MKIDVGTFAHNFKNKVGGTPSWGTSVGQSENLSHKITRPGKEDLALGMIYRAIDVSKVETDFGRGGNRTGDNPIVSAALFDKIFVNGKQVEDGEFILLLIRQDGENYVEQHNGRLTLKYPPSVVYDGKTYNEDIFNKINNTMGYSQDWTWFASDISVLAQDELHFRIHCFEKKVTFLNSDDKDKQTADLMKKNGILIEQSSSKVYKIEKVEPLTSDEEYAAALRNLIVKCGGKAWDAVRMFGVIYHEFVDKAKFTQIRNILKIPATSDAEFKKGKDIGTFVVSKDLISEAECSPCINTNKYKQFRQLLGWFVKQLNINNGVEEGTKTQGHGSGGKKIRKYYEEWRDFGSFTLDCNITGGYSGIISKSNYINVTGTGINIRPSFDEETKEVTNIYIDLFNIDYDDTLKSEIDAILSKRFLVSELDLLGEDEPNEKIKELFDSYQRIIDLLLKESFTEPVYKTGYKSSFSRNRIVFGAPGTGKSFCLNCEAKDLLKDGGSMERVTFHPDYTYANFVGTYKPRPYKNNAGEDSITYEYVPGPFMRTYVEALKNGKTNNPKPFLILIEEINRANVSAVFGDVFQLLDRDDDETSLYPVQASEDVKKYLAKELGGMSSNYSILKMPDNMFVWASMNSADQGVFPMDTAFKRRWDFKYLGINDVEDKIKEKYVIVGNSASQRTIEWNELRKAINDFMSSVLKINEDKLLGPYFVSKKILETGSVIDGKFIVDKDLFNDVFKSKVLMYLFEDAAKQKRNLLFDGLKEANKYSDICSAFDEQGVFIFNALISTKFAF